MHVTHRLAYGTALGLALAAAQPASAAQSVSQQIDALQQQIQAMQSQIQSLQSQVKVNQEATKQAQTSVAQAFDALRPLAAAKPQGPKIIQSPSNQFGLSSADGRNTIELTGRVMIDYGNYVGYTAKNAATTPTDLNSGANVRRGRFGITGKFLGDWNYQFQYDFGNTSDTINPFNGSSISSGIENAYIQYAGFKPFYVTIGVLDTPWTLEESVSSNYLIFLERATSQVIASNLVGGDFRQMVGANWSNDRAWVGAFVTGPQTGTAHGLTTVATTPTVTCTAVTKLGTAPTCTASTVNNLGGSAEQTAFVGRATYQVLQDDNYTLHVGVDGADLFQPPHAGGVRAVTLSDRPELRVDPTTLISTPAITRVSSVGIIGGELAASYGPVYLQGEYYDIQVNRDTGAIGGDYDFGGGHVDVAWTVTGEPRAYNPAVGGYNDPIPDHPFEIGDDGTPTGWGAFQIAARYSEMSLDDKTNLTSAKGGIFGGYETVRTLGLNWYPNRNIKFMAEWLRGNVDKDGTTGAATGKNIGQTFNAIAARVQFMW